jgi:hypothetical protein
MERPAWVVDLSCSGPGLRGYDGDITINSYFWWIPQRIVGRSGKPPVTHLDRSAQ